MSLLATQLLAQRTVTTGLLSTQGQPVVLSRAGSTHDGRGGQLAGAAVPQAVQTFFFGLLPLTARGGDNARNYTEDNDGRRVATRGVLVGRWDANMEPGDTFVINGVTFRVLEIGDNRSYETSGAVEAVNGGG